MHANPEGGGITSFAVCPARKVLAVGEAAERATLSVYDLTTCKRRKLLITAEASSKVMQELPLVSSTTCGCCDVVSVFVAVFLWMLLNTT